MSFKTFQNALAEEIRQQSGGRVMAVCRSLVRNNGVAREALEVRAPGDMLSPSVYLENFYEQHLKGVSVSHLAKLILCQYREFREKARLPEGFFSMYEKAAAGIYCKLINYERNRELLCAVPYEPWMDLAVVCYYQIEEGFLEDATILIQNSHLERWGISAAELMEHAWKNSLSRRSPELQKLSQVLLQWGAVSLEEEDIPAENPLYLLTNRNKCLGAVCICYPGETERIAEKIGSDYYVLPSSIHECLVLSSESGYSTEELQEMVREINRTQLQPQEVLSDRVYYYSRRFRRLSLSDAGCDCQKVLL